MNPHLTIPLATTPEQTERLLALQATFAQACNALAPLVQQTRTWNRVTLHHLAYRMLRERFPHMGSQMACNAIYSVSRTSRQVYQHPDSPFNLQRLGDRKLPLLNFTETAPVYFDRHTLSVRDRKLSMFTLDGRIHFGLALHPEAEAAFHERKLREIVLSRDAGTQFSLTFTFSPEEEAIDPGAMASPATLPEYILVEAPR